MADQSKTTFKGLVDFSGTTHAGLRLNNMTTAQRDALTPTAGMLIYNTSNSRFEKYEAGSWQATNTGVASKAFVIVGSSAADYITDGAADEVEINSAITAVNAAGGGIVFIKTGTYAINAAIVLKSNVALEGSGTGATILRCNNSTNIHVLYVDAVANVLIRNLEVNGNKANNASQTGHNIRVGHASSNIRIEDVYTHDAGLHGLITAYDDALQNDYVSIVGCRSDNNGVIDDGSGFYFNGCKTIVVSNCTASGNELDGIQWKTSSGIEISNCVSRNNGRDGFFAVDGHANIANCASYSNGSIGFHAQSGGVFGDTTVNVSNFESHDNGLDGIRISSCSNCGMDNIRSFNNGQSGSTAAGLYLRSDTAESGGNCTHNHVTNSCFYDTQGTPTQDFGIWGAGNGTVDLNIVTNCDLYGNSSTPVRQDTWSTTNMLYNVVGANPQRVKVHGNLTGSKTFDRLDGHYQQFTLTGNLTVTLTSGKQRGDSLIFQVTQDATGSRIITWPSNFKKAAGSLTLSTGAGAVDTITMVWDGTNWYESGRVLNES